MHYHRFGFRSIVWLILFIENLLYQCLAQFPKQVNQSELTIIKSPLNENITISFRSPPIGTCSTVFATQKQFAGYINLPPSIFSLSQGNYSVNLFFWFIEARQVPENAPFTVFLNGGPGSSSMVGLFQEVGPCEVVEVTKGKLGTIAREWGWDRSSNILFVDQPIQVGLSFDAATNMSMNLLNGLTTKSPTILPPTQPPYTYLNGTFGSMNPQMTANTSQIAAPSIWHLVQNFLAFFPEYGPLIRSSVQTKPPKSGINLFTESYGGRYAASISKFFRMQNALRKTDPIFANRTLAIDIASIGIMNGWIDLLTQTPFYPLFAYNNSYGIKAVSQVQQLNALSSFSGADGCKARTVACRAQAAALDPNDSGASEYVNNLCSQAATTCQNDVVAPFLFSGRSVYDISQNALDPFPSLFYLDYLNLGEVQEAIGTSINYTQSSQAVSLAFNRTGDYARDGALDELVEALDGGTRVGLIYGDRDYICNWVGGEAVSSAIAGGAGPLYKGWYAAGYAPIVTNKSYIGGVVREYGNLSFSRIYDAGHLVPAYQPETAFTVFSRIIQGTGVSLGNQVDLSNFSSAGDPSSTHKNTSPALNDPKCFIRAVNGTCNVDQKNMLANGAGVVINGVLYKAETDWTSPAASLASIAGYPGKAPQGMVTNVPDPNFPSPTASSNGGTGTSPAPSRIPTGVYTATEVPTVVSTTTSNAAAPTQLHRKGDHWNKDARMVVLLAFGVLHYSVLG